MQKFFKEPLSNFQKKFLKLTMIVLIVEGLAYFNIGPKIFLDIVKGTNRYFDGKRQEAQFKFLEYKYNHRDRSHSYYIISANINKNNFSMIMLGFEIKDKHDSTKRDTFLYHADIRKITGDPSIYKNEKNRPEVKLTLLEDFSTRDDDSSAFPELVGISERTGDKYKNISVKGLEGDPPPPKRGNELMIDKKFITKENYMHLRHLFDRNIKMDGGGTDRRPAFIFVDNPTITQMSQQ